MCTATAVLCCAVQVRGLLLASEVASAKQDYYLKGAHVVVGEPYIAAWYSTVASHPSRTIACRRR
jgi:2-keto-3-deoxy-galactonokinase